MPYGQGERENIVVSYHHQDKLKLSDGEHNIYHSHDDICRMNGWGDFEAAGRMSGTRFSVLYGNLCRFERDLSRFFLDYHCGYSTDENINNSSTSSKDVYTEVTVPYIVSRETLEGTGHLPKFEDDLFKLSSDHKVMNQDAFLIPTAEV